MKNIVLLVIILLTYPLFGQNIDTLFKGTLDSNTYAIVVEKSGIKYFYRTKTDSITELEIQNPKLTDFLLEDCTTFSYLASNCMDIITMTAYEYYYQGKPISICAKDPLNKTLYFIDFKKNGELNKILKYQFELLSKYCGNASEKGYVLLSKAVIFNAEN